MTEALARVEPDRTLAGIAWATLIAGVLDISDAILFTLYRGGSVGKMLAGIASGPLGSAAGQGPAAWIAGVVVHFAIMSVMAAAFVLAARRLDVLTRRPVLCGLAYGLALYVLMFWIVIPLRWPDVPRPFDLIGFVNQVLAHMILVGLAISLVAARILRREAP